MLPAFFRRRQREAENAPEFHAELTRLYEAEVRGTVFDVSSGVLRDIFIVGLRDVACRLEVECLDPETINDALMLARDWEERQWVCYGDVIPQAAQRARFGASAAALSDQARGGESPSRNRGPSSRTPQASREGRRVRSSRPKASASPPEPGADGWYDEPLPAARPLLKDIARRPPFTPKQSVGGAVDGSTAAGLAKVWQQLETGGVPRDLAAECVQFLASCEASYFIRHPRLPEENFLSQDELKQAIKNAPRYRKEQPAHFPINMELCVARFGPFIVRAGPPLGIWNVPIPRFIKRINQKLPRNLVFVGHHAR